jgi:co-chaperonin GroES (HSP10)
MALKRTDIEKAITPFGDRLFVRVYTPSEETVSEAGIIRPRRAVEREEETLVRAEILKVGPEANSAFKPGQFIYFPRFSGITLPTAEISTDFSYQIISGGDNAGCVCCGVEKSYARAELGLDEPRNVIGKRQRKVAS